MCKLDAWEWVWEEIARTYETPTGPASDAAFEAGKGRVRERIYSFVRSEGWRPPPKRSEPEAAADLFSGVVDCSLKQAEGE